MKKKDANGNEVEMTDDEVKQHREQLAAEANKTRNNERLERMNAISDNYEDVRAHDTDNNGTGEDHDTDDDDTDEEETDDDEAGEHEETTEDERDEARAAGADDIREVDGETQYRLVVNGKEKWLTLAQLRGTAQKVDSADEYLRNAAEAATKAVRTTPSAEDQTKAAEKVKAEQDRLRSVLMRVAMGDEEAIDQLARELAEPSRVTPDVLSTVDQRVDGRLNFNRAAAQFDQDYAEELKIPELRRYIVERDAAMATADPSMPFTDRLKAVGEEARKLRLALGGSASKKPDKHARKAAAPQVPQAAGRQRPEVEETDEEDYSSAIAKMAKSRGQGRSIQH